MIYQLRKETTKDDMQKQENNLKFTAVNTVSRAAASAMMLAPVAPLVSVPAASTGSCRRRISIRRLN
jgi:hypothetical protein